LADLNQGGHVPNLLSPDDLSEYIDVPKATLYNWRLRGYGPPAIKVGRHLRYRQADVEAWLDHQAESRPSA
jgi:excisionase family DNA binding protein